MSTHQPATPTPTERPALDISSLQATMAHLGMGQLHISSSTGSTNDDLVQRAKNGSLANLSVESTEHQQAGHGRLGRGWETPARSSLAISIFFRPPAHFDAAGLPWLSMLCASAMVQTLKEEAGISAGIKWPNDVVAHGAKLCGVLAQLVPTEEGFGVIVGAGLNVNQEQNELPVSTAASLHTLKATTTNRTTIFAGYLQRVRSLFEQFAIAHGKANTPLGNTNESLRALVAKNMFSLGHAVDAHLPDGSILTGTAIDLGQDGSLILRATTGEIHNVLAGDVFHLRRSDGNYA
ncbi:biotin--[acetyl-CoA-carboxylase] ligase [Arthrobacter sp. MYb227]|uniref:biotin--[acetyl-CoA-carboxylase] ligase n=1 Tax=Arthrobacter sp. MYb227 TaxID=1848601 RepID=UPI000CFC729B|nr:biotin--[acetyl-CoA-carboxylase] ligase [Arthrobacter sp. MYb227]PQZ91136.1 biotin--[acetyl-CoA-carboxylase] ligase [Arthrobacter sp. MYb227]